jgi:hypothetical protein
MGRPVRVSRAVLVLVVGAVLSPVTVSVVAGTAALLGAMGDSLGAAVLGWIALAVGLVWIIDLVCLVLVLAIKALENDSGES